MATVQEKLLTVEEFARLPDDGGLKELVRGKVVEMNMPMPRHGQVCSKIDRIYGNYAEDHDLGHVVSNDTGVVTERDPDSVRGADIAFYSYSKVAKGPLPTEHLSVAPDVVFEVLSPDDRWPKVLGKVSEYLDADVHAVCVVDPQKKLVRVYRADGSTESLEPGEELTLPEFAEEFHVPVHRIFE